MPRRVRMPAADELFRTTAGNGTLVHNGRGDEADQRPVRERGPGGHNPPAHGTAAPPSAAGTKGPEKTVPAPAGPVEMPAGAPPAAAAGTSASSAASASATPSASVTPSAASASSTSPASSTSADQGPSPASAEPAPQRTPARKVTAPRRPSGRERHDEKITVYVSPDELLGLEHARITLRGEYGVAVDRGRIVREAVAALLADLDARGRDSILVKRLSSGG